MIKPYFC